MELTDEWLDEHSEPAARCGSASIPCDDFLDILDLAARTKAFEALGLDRLQEMCDREEIQLDGNELRLLLMLASQSEAANVEAALASCGRNYVADRLTNCEPMRR